MTENILLAHLASIERELDRIVYIKTPARFIASGKDGIMAIVPVNGETGFEFDIYPGIFRREGDIQLGKTETLTAAPPVELLCRLAGGSGDVVIRMTKNA